MGATARPYGIGVAQKTRPEWSRETGEAKKNRAWERDFDNMATTIYRRVYLCVYGVRS